MSRTLQIGDAEPLPLTDFGFRAGSARLDFFGEGMLSLVRPQRLTETPIIGRFQRCVLRDAGVVRFVGWRDTPPQVATGTTATATYNLDGPWRWVKRKFFRGRITATGEVVDDGRASVTIGGAENDDGEPVHIPIRAQLLAILNQARTASGDAFDIAPLDDDFFTNEVPFEDRAGTFCSDLVRGLLSYMPTAVLRWTYGVPGDETRPVLHIVDSEDLEAAHELNGDKLLQVAVVRTCDELLRSQVDLVYTESDGTITMRTSGPVTEGPAAEANFAQVFPFSLREGEPVPADGLGDKLLAYFSHLYAEAQPTFIDGFDWARQPGDLWSFAGTFSQFAGLRSVCQSVQRDLFTRRESVALGPPPAPSTERLSKRSLKTNNKPDPNAPGGENSQTGTLTVAINEVEDMDASQVRWTAYGPESYSGAGEAAITVVPGHYSVVFEPVFDSTTGLMFLSQNTPSATVDPNGGAVALGQFGAVERLKLKDSDQVDDVGFDLAAALIIATGAPSGKRWFEPREIERCDGKRMLVLGTEWYDPPS